MAFPDGVRVDPLGESAYVLRGLEDADPVAVAAALSSAEGVHEATPCYDTVGVYVGPEFEPEFLPKLLQTLKIDAVPEPKLHEIPICYELGEDWEEAAVHLKLSMEELAQTHCRHVYRCYAVGFQPGFPYLGYLPECLNGLARRASPRPRVPAGSVGIVGDQTGIYPSETPGGWWLIGRTPLSIVDPAEAYFPISAGDEVRFVPISAAEFERRRGRRL